MKRLCNILLLTFFLVCANKSFAVDWPKKYRLIQKTATYREVTPKPDIAKNGIVHVRVWYGAGLGNRIKCIVSNLRYYKPKHLNLYWQDTDWVSARFFDLFKIESPLSISEYNNIELIRLASYPEPLNPYNGGVNLLVAQNEFKDKKYRPIDGEYNNIPPEIIKKYRPWFNIFKPSDKVQARINEVKLPPNTVAVQVRNAPDWQNYFSGNEPAEVFFELMDKYPKDTVFYLSAMSKEAAVPFYQRYGHRIIELPNKDYHSMIDATADMFLLGSTNEAIYSVGSTFSEVGWWLGGAKAKVTVAGSKDHWQYLVEPSKKRILKDFPK